ncbi:MAG: hypothetical protein A2830_00360 [Candidatus Taylorbacteria bacterium RIFCSPHIGHO2_01_FULL_44_110]|uniref:Uncharacterized protein n=1 Tax=Candidatus Taylorbacteria bacterium RIFCSPHIGHO2_12_FULL_45_16 TaxID=1802315 RepID=A0A1G2MY79_9BACT|nr:MAG: hypothetical protein A2830_00360 [Candidatus Taylorbacteria bacterium RIFCSPHIGHO2_01_FULL_44_110]OHA28840.1 MAG: hypothetical protein A3F51_02585 [Candidatus Taylorbacteria bacterium RIFCSPHIGHO2_12_FULL_45_16]OHA32899.1 MAG: hypothetical protein A3A23_03385 [Candidatus Taylorbacteria bacterium RIFCSPLOWO2_01_FULL_45_59]OHA39777.1 MAG: hypothetical protein A3I98_03395 [Candidatus Taylorbacteria bacterium RIFCSPLOWO2_02_FULL_45_10b]OHA45202.1 MAG: hypothetical protein A3G04_02315 [Candi
MLNDTQKNRLGEIAKMENEYLRGWRFAEFTVSIEIEELKELLQCPEITSVEKLKDVQDEIVIRKKWAQAARQITDEWFKQYPCMSKLVTGMAHRVALLRMAEFCNCSPEFLARMTEDILQEHEAGAQVVTRHTHARHYTHWSNWEDRPRDQYCLVLAILSHYTQRPAWVYRYLFLPGRKSSGSNTGQVNFKWVSDAEAMATVK